MEKHIAPELWHKMTMLNEREETKRVNERGGKKAEEGGRGGGGKVRRYL